MSLTNLLKKTYRGYAAPDTWRGVIGGDLAGMSNAKLWGLTGAMGGAAYGAVSSDTSMVGGALRGAALMSGGYGVGKIGAFGRSAYKGARAAGMGRMASVVGGGKLAAARAYMYGRGSSKYIGRTITKGYNTFDAMSLGGKSMTIAGVGMMGYGAM